MIKRFFAIAFLASILIGIFATSAHARGLRQPEATNLWIFGDSLSDTGNLSVLTKGEQPGPLYFSGRFSDGPVWVEHLAVRLGLDIDFNIPFTNNRAIAGAFSGLNGLGGLPIGVRSQVGNFLLGGGMIESTDLVIVWAGANDYFSIPPFDPNEVVDNLKLAVTALERAGARYLLVPNLPELGETPFARLLVALNIDPTAVARLNALTSAHNSLLSEEMATLANELDIEIIVVDINSAFRDVLHRQRLFGLVDVTDSCINQFPGPDRVPTDLCLQNGGTLDGTGVLFWDLIHPTGTVHELISVFAHATLVARENLPSTIFDPERVSTRIALAKLRVFGVLTNLGRFARRGDDFHIDASHPVLRIRQESD